MTSIKDEIDNFQFKLLSDLINSNIYEIALRWCKNYCRCINHRENGAKLDELSKQSTVIDRRVRAD
ncbi:hypothetical protein [Acinetobacter beijerinckii]|uniref:Uncharacterized protein n=1 Tax=Acinetobacter beijerinckii ANC 3835 TaxID=1217649 RepID=N9E3V9_9GAMM|nr:hypothetical protein [Acinetobacter beijerinckii]ENW05168.1 hypothetical protein F934_01900 [Acinetobacter beijerinckii ANC 3835]